MLRDDDVRDKKLTNDNECMGNSCSTEYRFYDNRAGRWLSIDPLASKFPWYSPYVAMGNNPVIMVDPAGDSVSIIISGSTLSSEGNSLYSNGLGGHVALNIDGKIYSFEGDGIWHIRKYTDYTNFEKNNRGLAEFTLLVNQGLVLQSLMDVQTKQSEYNVETNSCVSNTLDILRNSGVPLNVPNGVLTPEQVYEDFKSSKYITNEIEYSHFFNKSFVGRAFYSVIKLLQYNPLDRNINKIPLFSIPWSLDKKQLISPSQDSNKNQDNTKVNIPYRLPKN